MALDFTPREDGDDCPKCGSAGLYSEEMSKQQIREIMGDDMPEGCEPVRAHYTTCCDCSAGIRLREKMDSESGEPQK